MHAIHAKMNKGPYLCFAHSKESEKTCPAMSASVSLDKRLNTRMAPTCDWMIKIVKVNKL